MVPMAKNKALGFDLMGEGNLPSVCVVRPALRNGVGNPVLQFRRLLAGRRHTLPLVLKNDGNVPAQVSGRMHVHLTCLYCRQLNYNTNYYSIGYILYLLR